MQCIDKIEVHWESYQMNICSTVKIKKNTLLNKITSINLKTAQKTLQAILLVFLCFINIFRMII